MYTHVRFMCKDKIITIKINKNMRVEIQLHAFLFSTVGEGECQPQASVTLS
jgi:hypothetical protein